jgi:tetratricopeptide (TPR) repeat protein
MLLGVHLIARNEADVLERCLQSVKAFADEIIVADTGSTDDTVEIAKRYGARVLPIAWQDDFSIVRNEALLHARTLWVLVLDADEWLAESVQSGLKLREELKRTTSAALRIRMEHELSSEGMGNQLMNDAVRVFRADRGYLYVGEIHEQLVKPAAVGSHAGRMIDVNGPVSESGLTIKHDGYKPSVIASKAKAERNLRIIARQLTRRPNDPFCLYNYGVTMCQLGKVEDAREAFKHALDVVAAEAPFRPTLVRDYAKVLLVLHHAEEAAAILQAEVERYRDYTDLQLLYGDALRATGMLLEAAAAYEAAIAFGKSAPGYISEAEAGGVLAIFALADVLLELRELERAGLLFEQLLTERPLWEQAHYGLADVLHQKGIRDTVIRDRLVKMVGLRQSGELWLARCLTRIGAFDIALPLWRHMESDVLAERGSLQDVRRFAATLIGRGHYAEAGEMLLKELERRQAGSEGEQLRETAIDAALCFWNDRRALADEGLGYMAQAIRPESDSGWLKAIETMLVDAPNTVNKGEAWLAQKQEAVFAKELLERAVSLGMLRLAKRLADTDTALSLCFEHALYDQGYKDAAAEWMLRRFSEEGDLSSGHWFRLGELLYNKSLYSEALGMFERGASAGGATDSSTADRSMLGSAAASLQLALEALELTGAGNSRGWDGSWAESDASRLQEVLMRLAALGWKTNWNGVQRRRANGEAAEADFLMHDRPE